MLAQERHQLILSLIEDRGTVRTIDLAKEFQVADETIRRDLQLLAEANQVSRVHGGASSLSGRPKLQSFTDRRSERVDQKKLIAREALKLIQPGETIAFDSSTTGFELVLLLADLPIRVITNAHAIIHQLIDFNAIELVTTGGRYHPKTQTFNSPNNYADLQRHSINKAFVSCIGLDLHRGAAEGFEQQAIYKENLVQLSDEVILLMDSSKIHRRSEYFFAPLNTITHIITDSGASPMDLEILRDAGCKVTIATPD